MFNKGIFSGFVALKYNDAGMHLKYRLIAYNLLHGQKSYNQSITGSQIIQGRPVTHFI